MNKYKIMQLNHILLPAALVAVFAAASCSSGDSPDVAPVAGRALSFSADVDEARGRAVASSIAVEGSQFAVWGEYVPTAYPEQSPIAVFDAVPVTYTGGAWSYESTQYWFSGNSYSFAAIYPASVASESTHAAYQHGTSLTVRDYDVVFNSGIDLMTATATCDCGDADAMTPVAMRFNHLLARINFTARVNPSVTRAVIIKDASVYGVPSAGSWNGGKWTVNPSPVTTEENPLAKLESDLRVSGSDTEGRELFPDATPVLSIPQAVPYDAIFKMTYCYEDAPEDTRTYTYRLQIASTSLLNGWEAGSSYLYTFEIGSDDFILFSKPEVVKWLDSAGGNTIIQGNETT